MKFPLPRPLFPELEVTAADEQSLVALADAFIDKLLDEEHAFRVTNGGQVDTTRWKSIRSAEHTVVYRERASAASAPLTQSGEDKPASHKLVPPFLIVGDVPGSLDELLYGSSSPTCEATFIKASYVDDSIADADVLHSIRRPTPEEPFSHVTVKWFSAAVHSATFIAPRDFVYLDVVGTRELPDGGRIGYRFSHSIKLKGAEPLSDKGFLRSNFSLSTIYREVRTEGSTSNHVQVYGRAFYELCGAIPRSVYTYVVSLQVSIPATQRRCGQLKKLALAVRRAAAHKWTVAVPPPVDARELDSRCGVCFKALHLFNKSRSECALCSRRLCFACRVRKTLSFLDSDRAVTRWRVAFCSFCLQQAIHMPSTLAATEEFLPSDHDDERGFYRVPETLVSSASATPASTLRHFFSSA